MRIYEVRQNRAGTGNTTSAFRVNLPRATTSFSNHFLSSVSNTDYNFIRCSCRNGEQCFICHPINNLQDLEREFENQEVPNITINIADAVQRAMRGEEETVQNDVSRIPQYKAEATLEECGICLEKIRKRQKFRALPCTATVFHKFHSGCIDPWLRNNNTCPLCRRDVMGCK